MKKNMGSIDKIIRLLVAALIVVLYYKDKISGTLGIVLLIFAVVLVITSFISFCPLYFPFGLKTNKTKR